MSVLSTEVTLSVPSPPQGSSYPPYLGRVPQPALPLLWPLEVVAPASEWLVQVTRPL